MNGVLESVEPRAYNGVWRWWKVGSLGLFAIFVAAMLDCARTLRRLEGGQRRPEVDYYWVAPSKRRGVKSRGRA